jgi:hypothetical protein
VVDANGLPWILYWLGNASCRESQRSWYPELVALRGHELAGCSASDQGPPWDSLLAGQRKLQRIAEKLELVGMVTNCPVLSCALSATSDQEPPGFSTGKATQVAENHTLSWWALRGHELSGIEPRALGDK